MPGEVYIVATLTPKEGKAARLEELLHDMADKVHERESGTARYQMLRELDANPPRIVMVEKYDSKADQEHHVSTDHFKALFKAIGDADVLAKEGEIVILEPAGGFENR